MKPLPDKDGNTRCSVCGDEITDWGFGTWHHVTGIKTSFRGHDHDAVGNTTGWWDSRDYWHNGVAVTHTETVTDAGPNYCRECSEAAGEWVRWPCPTGANNEGGPAMTTEPTEHLPEVQRYAPNFVNLRYPDQVMMPLGTGEYVTYDNHVAALKAAETISSAVIADFQRQAREQGVSDERKRIRFAIAALVDNDVIDLSLSEYRAVVNAINEEES